jgi:hypothetical protein
MTEKKPKRWMSKAVKPENKGKFTAKAERAGESVHEYAEEKHDAGGTLGKEANLALTFEKAAHKRPAIYKHRTS